MSNRSMLPKGVLAFVISLATACQVAADGHSIKIGLTSSFTGPAALYGTEQRWGVEMAAEEINSAGGVLGMEIEFAFEDNRCNPTEAVKAVNALITQHEVKAIIGALCSSATLAALPVVKRAEVPLITSTSTAASITDQIGEGVNRWAFRSTIADDGMASSMVSFLKEEGVKSISIIGEDTDYGRGGAEVFSSAVEAHGIEVLSTDFVNPTSPEFTAIITKLKLNRPDRLAVYFTSTPLTAFYRQYETARLNIPGTGRLNIDHVLTNVLSEEFVASGGFDGTTSVNPYSPELDSDANREFVARFQEKYGQNPSQISFMAYEVVHFLAEAIRQGGEPTSAAIRDGLRMAKYDSMMGKTIFFDESHQVRNYAVVSGVKDGKLVFLGLSEG